MLLACEKHERFHREEDSKKSTRAPPSVTGEGTTPGGVDKEDRGLPERICRSRKLILTPDYSYHPNSCFMP
jgi:hypothetical protein